jgi:hypothetical protein
MKPLTPKSAARVIAESIRTQLGADAVVLIVPGSPQCTVVVCQASDAAARRVDSASEPQIEPPAHARQHSEKLTYSVAEAARVLGLSHSLIYDQLRTYL